MLLSTQEDIMFNRLFGKNDSKEELKQLKLDIKMLNETNEELVKKLKDANLALTNQSDYTDKLKDRVNDLKLQLEKYTSLNEESMGLVCTTELSISPKPVVKKPVVKKQDLKLLESFEKQLNSCNLNCRGGCKVLAPKTGKVEDRLFASRKEAEKLVKDFKSGKLILVE